MKPISEGVLRYQAMRCETAKYPRCKCRCGGAFHGTKHADEWIAEEAAVLEIEATHIARQLNRLEAPELADDLSLARDHVGDRRHRR